jgi:AcrR family transcriptional regulator
MASRPANGKPARPVGRPRAVPRDVASSVREEILAVAAGLFETSGYTATTTRSIALGAGLRQASLFHYFGRKQDILSELLDRTVRPTLELVSRVPLNDLDEASALWLLVHVDVTNLCKGPHNLGALQLLPEARDREFEWFWRRRRRLFGVYAAQITRGIATGCFPLADQRSTADVVFGLSEGVITARPHVRRRSQTPEVTANAALRVCGVSPSRVRAASRALRYLPES